MPLAPGCGAIVWYPVVERGGGMTANVGAGAVFPGKTPHPVSGKLVGVPGAEYVNPPPIGVVITPHDPALAVPA